MGVVRCSGTMKASGVPSNMKGYAQTFFFYLDDTALDADIITAAQALAGLQNGDLVSVSKQLSSSDDGNYASATANGGSSRARITAKDASANLDQITLPFLKQSVSHSDIEAVVEGATGFKNRQGNAIGTVVAVRESQVAE